ncbi:cyclic nucleotide-binding domain-containing protein [Roseobacter litoralis]|uniref:ABC transporter cyclic nucleotide-binding protein n=1 Tax=Roseobacter litoralis (strain ATCC 49566 / DSM 6996 / JCM 21268 / NBRC 15278 / OCh 149) TaxID=391595 RepID=F7ZE62_ROSLO|nr:cyclic nucleotide-binding domain-containing protein [Roseobacter litoralis]AEI93383.1 putative ABC transporter cyclic nucleotide-binding protein [Roseobacter litoralis Och 149]
MGVRSIEKTLFKFIWRHSKRDQFILLAVTLTLFPFLYLTLELPKRIINDAIGSQMAVISVAGFEFTQVQFLWLLCMAFLLSVLVHGLLKMRINTMKGVLSERMLRRLRYGLIERMLRFPKPYFRRTSQGELVAMITGETEPMGGMMGDALAQPVLQAGQMLTILMFLFLQSVWFGLAAIALIPLQAWLIPKLQRQINIMNKARIKEVRALAALIGETANGVGDLRQNGGWRYRLALVTQRLGIVYAIRFRIYQKKFFMKFINNFITQLTPFFFFAVGGYLVIQGAVSLGALVAALAAYKDLSSPWKELLAYYNQAQDMSLRWETVVDKLSPTGVIDETLIHDQSPTDVRLNGDLAMKDVNVMDADGNMVLEGITLNAPPGALVAIEAQSEEDRQALADVLTREVMPLSGTIHINGHALRSLHQTTLAHRIGHATSHPALFRGSFGDNVMMSMFQALPQKPTEDQQHTITEALASGNSPDLADTDWIDPDRAGEADKEALRRWWLTLIDAIGSDGPIYRKSLDQIVTGEVSTDLQQKLVECRPIVWAALKEAALEKYVHRFDPQAYNPALPVTSNLIFATLRQAMTQDQLAQQTEFFALLRRLNLESSLLSLAKDVIELLAQIFGQDGTEHPLFRKLGLEPAFFEKSLQVIASAKDKPLERLSEADKAVLMTIPAQITAEQIGPAFTETMKQQIVTQRVQNREKLMDSLGDIYAPLDPSRVAEGVSVLENALFGKLSDSAGARADDVRRRVSEVLEEEGLKSQVIDLIYDVPLELNGSNLPAVFAEALAVMRATIKRPDILIMEQTLTSYDMDLRVTAHKNIRKLLPDATMIYISDRFEDVERFDVHLEIVQGRMQAAEPIENTPEDSVARADLQRKLRALEATDLFSGLNRRQLRLLAFGAKWFEAEAGDTIFSKGDDPTDGAYMILSGEANLLKPSDEGHETLIATVEPGKLVGELGLIRNEPRALTMRAKSDVMALRIGAEEFLAVVENDAATAFKLLQVVAGYAGN